MQDLSQLTDRELRIVRDPNVVNLGDAYPQIPLPEWFKSILTSDVEVSYRSLITGQRGPLPTSIDLHTKLLQIVCYCLGIDIEYSRNAFVTFSDSMSLFHAIASQVKPGDSVITTNPSIDIVSGMVRKYTTAELIHVPTSQEGFSIDVSAIEAAVQNNTSTIIITSPENPTGSVCTALQIKQLVSLSVKHDITLIFDQCFAKLNPNGISIPLLPDFGTDDLKWIFLWGTGKNFGLDGDKLGFIFCSPNAVDDVRKSLSLLQFEISRRQLLLFHRILDTALQKDYFGYLAKVISSNSNLISLMLKHTDLKPQKFDAGSVILVDISSIAEEDQYFTDKLLAEKSVGIIPARYFFYENPNGTLLSRSYDFVRIALARKEDYLQQGIQRLVDYCGTL